MSKNFKTFGTMKKIINANIGGRNFIIDDDAYNRLSMYLEHFKTKVNIIDSPEVMNDLEMRIAELFENELGSASQVVNINMVNSVIAQLGMPDGSKEPESSESNFSSYESYSNNDNPKRLYRDVDEKAIAGVCSGMAAYFGIDVVPVRIIMLILLITGSLGFWIYLVFWIVAPKAMTPAQKCELRGMPATAENMAKFSNRK